MTTTRASPGKAVRRSGCSTGMSKRFALSFAGGAALLRPRPCGLSGRVSRSSMSYPRPASPSRIAAPKGAVAATAIFMASASPGGAPPLLAREKQARPGRREPAYAKLYVGDRGRRLERLCSRQECWRASPDGALLADRAEDGLGAELGERGAALLRCRPVDGQDAVEMVELVLDHPCLQPFGLDADGLSFRRRSFDLDRGWTIDLDYDGGGAEREAALVGDLDLFAGGDDPRVDERDDRLLFVLPVDENPPEDAELGGRETDTARLVHEQRHALDEPGDRLVEIAHLIRLHPQNRVRILANEGKRGPTPGFTLGVELLASNLPFDLTHRGKFYRGRTRVLPTQGRPRCFAAGRPCGSKSRPRRPRRRPRGSSRGSRRRRARTRAGSMQCRSRSS